MTTNEFMEKILFIAKEKEIKITNLENEAGLSKGYSKRLLTNGHSMSIDHANALAEALGMTFEQIIMLDLRELKANIIKSEIAKLESELNELNNI